MSRIRILAENVANKIAAGEVVERPASVVKELLENALDAGARSIRIEVESGGKRMIRVIDDGSGMNHDDALLAFERHATSKLRTADDLLSIATLGFRGEALPSIASISRLLLETRTPEEEQGTRIEFAGGKLIGVKPAGVPAGTSISVADIFYCVPARRKFLKSETTELGPHRVARDALRARASRQAISAENADAGNSELRAGGKALRARLPDFRPPGARRTDRDSAERSAGARRRSPNRSSKPDEQAATIRVTRIHFAPRSAARESQRNLHFREPAAGARPAAAARHQRGVPQHRAAGRVSRVLLFLDLPYQEVDVNVHPAKIEVRFRHPQFVHDFTRDALRHALSLRAADSRISRGARGCGGRASRCRCGISTGRWRPVMPVTAAQCRAPELLPGRRAPRFPRIRSARCSAAAERFRTDRRARPADSAAPWF